MSDSSETSSVNGEWDLSLESRDEIVRLKEEMKSMKEDMSNKLAELQKRMEEMELRKEISQEKAVEDEEGELLTPKSENVQLLDNEASPSQPPQVDERNMNVPIDSFLGIYTLVEEDAIEYWAGNGKKHDISTIVIRKAKFDGYFSICWICEKGKVFSTSWIPDNVQRNGRRVWIEGNVLKRDFGSNVSCYELTENGLQLNGKYKFIRV